MGDVKAYCYSNIDGFNPGKWPDRWVCLPRIGDRVESVDRQRMLKVVGVEHKVYADGSPYAAIELHEIV